MLLVAKIVAWSELQCACGMAFLLPRLDSVSIDNQVNLIRMIVYSVDPSITFSRFKYSPKGLRRLQCKLNCAATYDQANA